MEHKVCSIHFLEKDVKVNDEHVISGKVVLLPRKRADLRPGALPLKFDTYPKYYQPKINQRKPPPKRTEYVPKSRKRKAEDPQNLQEDNTAPDNTDPENIRENLESDSVPENVILPKSPQENQTHKDIHTPAAGTTWTHHRVNELILPEGWIVCNTLDDSRKILVHVNPKTIQIDKSIIFRDISPPEIIFRGTVHFKGELTKVKVTSLLEAQKIVNTVAILKVCEGTGIAGKPFSVACNGHAVLKGKRCSFCTSERERQRKLEARKDVRLKKKRSRQRNIIQSLKRSKLRLLTKVGQVWLILNS